MAFTADVHIAEEKCRFGYVGGMWIHKPRKETLYIGSISHTLQVKKKTYGVFAGLSKKYRSLPVANKDFNITI